MHPAQTETRVCPWGCAGPQLLVGMGMGLKGLKGLWGFSRLQEQCQQCRSESGLQHPQLSGHRR